MTVIVAHSQRERLPPIGTFGTPRHVSPTLSLR
jgi:hypothetical protein